MAGLQRKLGRRYQRYISARQAAEDKEDEPRDIWERITKLPDVLSAMVIDSQSNDVFYLHGLNSMARHELNIYCREYMEMAVDFSLNMDPTDEVTVLRIRNDEREIVLACDDGTIFVVVQSLSKSKTAASTAFSLDA